MFFNIKESLFIFQINFQSFPLMLAILLSVISLIHTSTSSFYGLFK